MFCLLVAIVFVARVMDTNGVDAPVLCIVFRSVAELNKIKWVIVQRLHNSIGGFLRFRVYPVVQWNMWRC